MIIRMPAAFLCLAVAACSVGRRRTPRSLPFAAFGTMDNDVAAANQAAWAFAAPERTANNPVDAARAAAAIDYLAGELASNPRWLMVSPLTKQEMMRARIEVRQVLGIVPNAPSQVVVTALLRFASQWQGGNQTVAMQALAAPGLHPAAGADAAGVEQYALCPFGQHRRHRCSEPNAGRWQCARSPVSVLADRARP